MCIYIFYIWFIVSVVLFFIIWILLGNLNKFLWIFDLFVQVDIVFGICEVIFNGEKIFYVKNLFFLICEENFQMLYFVLKILLKKGWKLIKIYE